MQADWVSAVNQRKSTRIYEPRPLSDTTMANLEQFANNLKVPFEHAVKIRFFKADPNRRLGNTMKHAAPDNAAFITATDLLSISKAGFVGEMLILYATSLGLDTCWFGHYSLAELERVMPHLGPHANEPMPAYGYGKGVVPGERAICITPLGFAQTQGLRLMDRMTGSLMSFKRKPLDALLEGGVTEESLPPHLVFALDLARKAPSAGNSQFWRFTVAPDHKTVSIAMPVGYKHFKWAHPNVDIGACACHFWLGLLVQSIDCKVTLSEEQERAVWKFEIN